MTTTIMEPRVPSPPIRYRRRNSGRIRTLIILLVSLACSGILRQWAMGRQAALTTRHGVVQTNSNFADMNSYALALLLGGLRGPLVMYLWSSSESQKVDRDLEDFDTKVEWIRLLQPEFDTVIIFQIWNKAYNISAMMASPANKYSVIMDALDFAQRSDSERPGNLNILNSISTYIYGGKLGSKQLPEFPFYARQFHEESMQPESRRKSYPEDRTFRRLDKVAPCLDDTNHIRADLLKPTRERPVGLAADAEWNDGSAFQYMRAYDQLPGGFPYGMSALGLAYNYAKRAEVALNAEGQKPVQLSAMVIDSRPGLALKFWGEDEARRGRAYEQRAFGNRLAGAPNSIVEKTMAEVKPTAVPADRAALDAAMYYYENAARVSRDAVPEYQRHLAKPDYAMRYSIYKSHLLDLEGTDLISTADYDYLAAIAAANGTDRAAWLIKAREKYRAAEIRFERTVLEFYTEDRALAQSLPRELVTAQPVTNREIGGKLPESALGTVYDNAMERATQELHQDYGSERSEYGLSIARCRTRLAIISDALKPIGSR